MELSKVYGDVFSLFVGSQLVVVLNGYEVIRDALSNHAEAFSDRPDIPLITILTKRKGESSSGIIHSAIKRQLSFAYTHLKGSR